MSYMNTHAAFAPAGGIQELSFDEVDLVDGAIVPFFFAAACAATYIQMRFIDGMIKGYHSK